MPRDLKVSKRLVGVIIVVGFFIGFGSGLVENSPNFASVPENRYYGFPFVWRAVNVRTGEKYTYAIWLFIDCLFGAMMASITAVTALSMQKWMMKKDRQNVKSE
jgi:hypothetical protein